MANELVTKNPLSSHFGGADLVCKEGRRAGLDPRQWPQCEAWLRLVAREAIWCCGVEPSRGSAKIIVEEAHSH
jgi:hypothetical protein